MTRTALLFAAASLLLLSCSDDSDHHHDPTNNTTNTSTSSNASTQNSKNGPRPSWDFCTADSQFQMEAVEENGLTDPFGELPLGYARAFYNPVGDQVGFIFMRSDSDDLEDAADFDTIFLFFANLQQSPTGEFDVPPGTSSIHQMFAQKRGDVVGLDAPWFETRGGTIRWESEKFATGEPVRGSIDLTIGVRCGASPGTVTYRAEFETIWRNPDQRETDPCGREQIDGDWIDLSKVGELEILRNGVLWQPEFHYVYIDNPGEFAVIAADSDGAVELRVDEAMTGENPVSFGVLTDDGCAYGASGETVTLDAGENGDLQLGPSSGSFQMNLSSEEPTCSELDLRGNFTFGVCPNGAR